MRNSPAQRKNIRRLTIPTPEEIGVEIRERCGRVDESARLYQTLVETIKDIVYTVDLEGRFTYVSPNVEGITGYRAEELLGEHFTSILIPDHRGKSLETFAENVRNQQTITLEVAICTDKGREIPMELNSTMLYDAHGASVGRLGVARNIMTRRAEEEKRKALEVKALTQDKLASLGEIATGIAHEINQPLSFIKLILQSTIDDLVKGSVNPEEIVEYFQESLRQVGKISNIISHLRTFGRNDGTSFGPVSLERVIGDTLILMRERLRINNIDMIVTECENFPTVYGNHIKLEQVFLNLIQNSMDAMAEQGGGEINLTARMENDHVLICFSDTGEGISTEHRQRIFEPFYTTKEADKGTGIGLSVVYGIILEHKGEISCISQRGRGTTFTIRLPGYTDQPYYSPAF